MGTNVNLITHMKSKVLNRACCLIALGIAMVAPAAPFQRADVPADLVWVAHIDCDSLRRTAIGKYLLEELKKPEAQNKLAAFEAMFNFDPRTQLHGLTLYTANDPKDGVLIAYGDFDPERLVTMAKAAKDAKNSAHNQHVIYNWIDEKKHATDGVKPRTYAAIDGKRVIFGQREARVAAALDVLNGAVPNLSSSKLFPQMGAANGGGFLQAAARKLDIGEGIPHAAVLKMSKMARLQVGEAQQQATATLSLETESEDVATNIAAIAKGLVSLMKLQKEKPEALKVADALSVKQDGASVVATLSMPSADVIELMKADAARKAQRHKEETSDGK
jgi:hypothetical protein